MSGTGFSSPIAGSGGSLTIPRIKSPDYVAGSAGWTINKDGSAEFNNGTFRGPLAVGPASPAARTVFVSGADVPAELQNYYTNVYSVARPVAQAELMYVNATDYFYIANLAGTVGSTFNIVVSGFAVGGTTVLQYDQQNYSPVTGSLAALVGTEQRIAYTMGSTGRATANSEFFKLNTSVTANLNGPVLTNGVNVYDPSTGNTAETWHSFAYAGGAGWNDNPAGQPVQYRLVPSPSNCVQFRGESIPGTLADGTVIGTLPVGYRPANIQSFTARKAAGQYALFQLNTNGQIKVFDGAGSTLMIFIPALLPLDA